MAQIKTLIIIFCRLYMMIFKMKEQRISIGGFSSEAEVWLYKS